MSHWCNDAENSALNHRNELHFKIYWNRKQFFQIVIIFHNITVFTVFFNPIHGFQSRDFFLLRPPSLGSCVASPWWSETKITLHQQRKTMVFKYKKDTLALDHYLPSSKRLIPLKSSENLPIWCLLIRLFTSNVTSYVIPLRTLGPVSVTFSPAAPGLDACVLSFRFWAESTAVTYQHSRIQTGLGPLSSMPDLAQFHFCNYCTLN